MRGNIVLLELLKQEFKQESEKRLKDNWSTLGLCFSIIMLRHTEGITLTEEERLNRLIVRTNVPQKMKEHPSFIDEDYWWKLDKIGMEQRILFLDYLISKESRGFWSRMLKKLF